MRASGVHIVSTLRETIPVIHARHTSLSVNGSGRGTACDEGERAPILCHILLREALAGGCEGLLRQGDSCRLALQATCAYEGGK